jgi:hypothetical protein
VTTGRFASITVRLIAVNLALPTAGFHSQMDILVSENVPLPS